MGHGEGFLLATLLQSVLCAMMLALAFAASQYWGLTGIKSCFAAALSQETEAAEVFAAVQRRGIPSRLAVCGTGSPRRIVAALASADIRCRTGRAVSSPRRR